MPSLKVLHLESALAKFQTVNNMKRLFLTFGLVIAFFFTAQLSAATIFDNASYQAPKTSSVTTYMCFVYSNAYIENLTLDACYSAIVQSATPALVYDKPNAPFEFSSIKNIRWDSSMNLIADRTFGTCFMDYGVKRCFPSNEVHSLGRARVPVNSDSATCPPDAFPNYIFSRDTNNDGKTDQCYNPDELDNASNCANQVGSMLPALTNLATKVCKTDQASGARCGYSRKDSDLVYKLDLEMNCFGDSENQVPEYNPEPMPEPSNCAKYNDGLMVCKEKPENKCDANGNCQDQCGFFNKEFYCFINCSGEECDKETPPPVNCETNPTAPVCVEEPDPEPDPDFCKNNPTDPKCTTPPDGGGGDGGSTGGGGTSQKVDLKPVVDELKSLNDKLDFSTTQNDSTRKMGLLETAFDDDAISELKSKTDEIKTEINGFYTSTKAEISSMFSFSTGGGSYEPITFAFTYGTYSSKIWEYFSQNVAYIAAAIMFLAYLMAARIVLE